MSSHIPKTVLALLASKTGIADPQAWTNILSLTSKAEQNRLEWWLDDQGHDIYTYAKALPYDWHKRGVTVGLCGFTTHDSGKFAGDALDVFDAYHKLGGKDLKALAKDCATSSAACNKVCDAIHALKGDDSWILAQWEQLFNTNGNGYLYEVLKASKAAGFDKPKPLTVAALYDCAMNQGATGHDGMLDILKHVGHQSSEAAFLKKFLQLRLPIAGKNAFNDPPVNGKNRVQQYLDILEAGDWGLKDQGLLKKASSWEMK